MSFHGLLDRDLYRNLDLHLVRVVRRSRDLRRSRLAGLPGVCRFGRRNRFAFAGTARRIDGRSSGCLRDRIGCGAFGLGTGFRLGFGRLLLGLLGFQFFLLVGGVERFGEISERVDRQHFDLDQPELLFSSGYFCEKLYSNSVVRHRHCPVSVS